MFNNTYILHIYFKDSISFASKIDSVHTLSLFLHHSIPDLGREEIDQFFLLSKHWGQNPPPHSLLSGTEFFPLYHSYFCHWPGQCAQLIGPHDKTSQSYITDFEIRKCN